MMVRQTFPKIVILLVGSAAVSASANTARLARTAHLSNAAATAGDSIEEISSVGTSAFVALGGTAGAVHAAGLDSSAEEVPPEITPILAASVPKVEAAESDPEEEEPGIGAKVLAWAGEGWEIGRYPGDALSGVFTGIGDKLNEEEGFSWKTIPGYLSTGIGWGFEAAGKTIGLVGAIVGAVGGLFAGLFGKLF